MIELRDVSFSYDRSRIILDHVSAAFSRGKTYSIFGPSGSGKSTLLALMGGVVKPDEGEILIHGQNIVHMDGAFIRRTLVSYIFQDYLLFPFLTALENVKIAYEICVPDTKDADGKAKQLLAELGIDETLLRRPVRFLSGGEQQRVGIARALASGAPYLLADEPTGNLDQKTAATVIHLLIKMTKEHEKGCIIVTHSDMVRSMTDECFLLEDGRLEQFKGIHYV